MMVSPSPPPLTPTQAISHRKSKVFVVFEWFVVMGLTFERGREISLGKQRLSCERHGLHLFSALRIVRCTLIYIYTVYIYIFYVYISKIFLQAWVCSFSNTTKSKSHTITTVLNLYSDEMFWGISLPFFLDTKFSSRPQSTSQGICFRTGLIFTFELWIN